MKTWLGVALFLIFPGPAWTQAPAPPGELYRTTLVQAAPGRLLELIDALKAKTAEEAAAGAPPTYWMRHSQGDRWDLLLLAPAGSYAAYYSGERAQRRMQIEAAWRTRLEPLIAWQEDIFVWGPPSAVVKQAFDGAGFFHVEIFQALAGKRADLLRQREMENAYLKALGRPQNLIFARDSGAAWDVYTIGFYRDLKHYAESADIPDEKEEAAAKAAGFGSAGQIGPYLRTLIQLHHDTLAVAIR